MPPRALPFKVLVDFGVPPPSWLYQADERNLEVSFDLSGEPVRGGFYLGGAFSRALLIQMAVRAPLPHEAVPSHRILLSPRAVRPAASLGISLGSHGPN